MSKRKISILKRDYKFLTNRFIENFELRKRVYDLQIKNEELKSELELYENGVYFSNENDDLQIENDKLKDEIKELNESITWWNNRFKAVERENEKLKGQVEYLRSNEYLKQVIFERDFSEAKNKFLESIINKAIECIEEKYYDDLLEILRGEGELDEISNERY